MSDTGGRLQIFAGQVESLIEVQPEGAVNFASAPGRKRTLHKTGINGDILYNIYIYIIYTYAGFHKWRFPQMEVSINGGFHKWRFP